MKRRGTPRLLVPRPGFQGLIEELEARILYSADVPAAVIDPGLATDDGAQAQVVVLPATLTASQQASTDTASTAATVTKRLELVFIDASVPDADQLLNLLQSQNDGSRTFEIHWLDAQSDGISQITEVLKGREGIDAIHLLSHGDAGSLQLGNGQLDSATLKDHLGDLSSWGAAMTADADLMLYGCDLASTADGRALVDELALLTGADVAASTDATGAAVLGGNWTLEYQDGLIETGVALNATGQTAWQHLLAVTASTTGESPVNSTTTGTQENNIDSGKQVAADANGNYVVVWEDATTLNVYGRLYNADGTAKGAQFQVNTNTATTKDEPTVAMDANGNFVVAWRSATQDGSGYGVYAQRYNASGVAQGSEFRVNTYTSSDQFYPAIAMNTSGFVITWTSYLQDGDNYGVYAQRYDANGVAQGSEFRVNTYTTNIQKASQIGMDDSGNFVIAWSSYAQDGAGYGVYAQRYNASGVTQGSEFRVNVTTTGEQNLTDVSMNSSGSFVIAWYDSAADGNGNGVYARTYNSSGVAQSGEILLATFTFSTQWNASVAMGSDGSFVAAWETYTADGYSYGIAMRQLSLTGAELSPETIVNTTLSGDQQLPSVAWGGNQVIVTWSGNGSGDNLGVFSRRYNTSLPAIVTSVGTETRANTTTTNTQQTNTDAGKQVATAANGNYVVVWEDTITDYAYARLYAADGTPLTAEFRVNTDTTAARNKDEPTVAMDDAGNFVIAWRSQLQDGSGYGIYAQRYNASGVAQGSEFKVNTTTSSDQQYPAIAMSATGFVITWTSNLQDGSSQGVYAQRYNASGVAQGSEFRVNTTTSNIQTGSKIGMDDAGNFVIAWSSYTQDGSGYGIYAQRYNASGVAQGSEFQVNVTTTGDQVLSDVSMNGSGSFVIAWSDPAADGSGYGTFGRTYNSSGTATSGEVQLNNFNLGTQRYASVSMADSGNFVVVFQSALQDGYGNAIALRVFSQSGVEIGAERLVNTTQSGDQNAPSVSWNGNYLVVSWSGNGTGDNLGVFFQRYTSNAPPVITSNGGGDTASVNVPENSTAVTTVVATDADGNTLTYSITGGADAAKFTIDGSTGVLRFISAPDYENPTDNGANNVYDVIVTVTDGITTDSQAIAVTVTAVNEAPTATITAGSYSATEQTSLNLHGTGMSVADVDAGSGNIKVMLIVVSGTLNVAAGTTGVTVSNSGTSSVTLNGTLAQINKLLAGNLSGTIVYVLNSDAPPATDTLTLSVDDLGNSGSGGNLTASAAVTINVTAVNDAPTGTVTISGTVAQNQTLTASNNIADPDGLGTITYHWYRAGVDTGATGSTYALTEADVGKAIVIKATYTDAYGTAESVSSAATAAVANVNDAPTGTVTITGTPTQNQTLTASNNIADIDGLGTITYHWYRSGVDTGSTGSTYVLTEADVGQTIVAKATYTDGHGTAETVTSAATAAVANVNDAPTGSVTITGTATQNQTLTASNNIADIDGLGTITYHWYRGGVDTGATGSTYALTEADVGKTIVAKATYTDGHGTAETVTSAATAAVANVNDAPTGTVTITGTPTQNQTLTASNNIADIDGLGTITYHWFRGGVDTGATGSTYALTEADVGQAIVAKATYTDGHGTAETVSSAATAAVVNVNDAPTGAVTITGTPTQNQTLTASNNIADIDGLGTITYHWYRGGVDTGSTGSTYLLTEADVGQTIVAKATYTDGHGTAETVSSAATAAVANVNDAPTGSVTITGTATQNQTLTASNNIADIDGLGTITYRWYRDGADTGSTGSTYLLTETDVGKAITVRASYTDGHGTAETVTSAATAAVANVNDAPTGTVTITGTATQNQTLTASNNIADIDGLGTITYHWYRGGVDTGGTGSTYLLTEADVGQTIVAKATYTDGHGTAETVTSAATAAVANVNDAPTGSVTITGTPTQNQTLTASNNIADIDGLGTITYHWYRGGVDTGSTGSTYVLTEADVGQTIVAKATYTDGHGTAETVSSAATAAVANVNDVPTGSVTVTGTPTQNQTLTASNNIADIDGLGTITYHWFRGGVDTGATGSTYALTEADVGKTIVAKATYTDGHGTAETVTSAATAAVANVNDAPTGSVTITGTATQNQTLTASNNIADIDGLGTITYHWFRAGVDTGSTGSTYLLTEADVGQTIVAKATYTDGHGTVETVSSAATAAVANVNDAPTGTVTITGTATQNQTLTASNNIADIDGLGTITYRWYRDGVDTGSTGSTYVLAESDVGKAMTAKASYTDGHGTAESVTSAATAAVANVNDAPTGSVTITGTATQNQTLTASNNIADIDGLGTIIYHWYRGGVDTGSIGSTYALTEADVGQTIVAKATYTDGHGTAETVSSAATAAVANVNDAPTGTVTITGTATQNQTLTASNNIADIDGLGTITYHWYRGGVDTGSIGSTYLLTEADVGKTIVAKATYTDGHGTAETVSSAATAAVANVNDAPTGSVTITGTATQNQTLTASNTIADLDGLGTITYRWYRDGVDTGSTGSTYVLTETDVGKAITAKASYTDGHGTAESVTSAATAAVANVNDAPTGSVSISGTTARGATLTASNTLADLDGLGTITYHWLRDGVDTGSTGNTYALTLADVGSTMSVKASYTDGHGTAESVDSVSTAAIAGVNDAPTGSVTITGTAEQNQTLTASNDLADTDGLGTITYHWLRDGVDTGGTGSTYLLTEADVGKAITARATYTDGQGTFESVDSAATAAVANVNDAPTGAVTITGTATRGSTLTASHNLADLDGMGTITYHWLRDGVDTGSTGATYLLSQADVGAVMSAQAQYTDGHGTLESVDSAGTSAVAPTNDAPTGSVTITGTAEQNQILTASNNLADPDGLGTITYHWLRDGIDTGSTGSTYALTEADVGQVITARATYTDGHGTAESVDSSDTAAVANVNDAPTGLVTITGTATQNQTLTASHSLADPDGLGTISYHWLRDGVDTGATGSTYLLTEADVGKAITARATYTDGHGAVESVDSAATAAVANVNDAPTGSVTITGTVEQNETLTASDNLADPDGLGTVTYHWLRDGIDTGSTGSTYALTEADVGKAITARATYTDGHGTAESVDSAATAAVANVNDAPTGSVTITGTVEQNETLTASDNLADPDGLGTVTYHWLRDGVDTGNTGSTYVLSESDVGKAITARATYTDGHGTVESVTSAATAAVANVNDAPAGSVTIGGTATQNQTLTASHNLADLDGLGAITYHWLRDGVDTGSTGSTYLLTEADVGQAITARATYTDGHGTVESVDSAATAAVANVNDVPTGSVTITGTPTQNQTLTASDTLADLDGLGTVTYHWLRDGIDTGNTGSTYLLTEADVGKAITARANYTDGHGKAEAVNSAATAAVANVNDAPTGSVTITGTAEQNQTLSASHTLADLDGLGTITYHWLRDGVDTGATGGTYVLTEADVGQAITARATYTDGHGTAESVDSTPTSAVVNVNDAPTGGVTITGTAAQNQNLTASHTLADLDGLGTITYHWLRDGIDTGSTGATYLLTEADVGKTLTARATYTDGHGTAESVTSAATAAVANVNDAPTGSVTITGTAEQNQTLSASHTLADLDGLGTVTYHWLRDGIDTGSTGTTYALTEADVGKTITARAAYTDGHGTVESVDSAATAAVANVNDAPTGSVTITGTAAQNQTLTASHNLADLDGLGTVTYHWLRDGVDTGSTGSTYLLTEADVGKAITAHATYTDGHGTAESVDSTATSAVTNVNDAPTGSVTITGTVEQNATLTASHTLADPDGLGTVTYHWLRDGVDTGSTGATYALTEADVGQAITARATYTDGHGAAESVDSAATAAVANVNDAPTGGVTVTGTPTQNQTLSASHNLADLDGLGAVTYHWLRDGVDTGSTGATYALTEADVGQAITARATYTDGHGTAESVDSAATSVVVNLNDAPTGTVTITGTAAQNQTLSASHTLADLDGLGTVTYHWLRDGIDTGSTGTTYLLTEADVGKAITARATYTDGHGTVESVASTATSMVTNVNDAPTGGVTITGTPTQNQTLSASHNLADLDGLGTITYHWLRDGIDTGSTGTTYLLTEVDVGKTLTARATYTDGHGTAESIDSAATSAVVNVNDAPTGTVTITITGTAEQNQTLSASHTLADPDGLGTVTYHWLRDGIDTGATGTTYLLTEADVGKTLTARATYTDGHGTAESIDSATTSAVLNVNDAPTGAVTLTGTPTQNQTLSAGHNLVDLDGLGTITYHWLRDGIDTGTTGGSYTLTQSDVGRQISVTATYTDQHGTVEAVTSQASPPVANVNDAPTMNSGDLQASANPSVTLDIGSLLNNATDPDGDTLSVQVLSTVSHGQLTVLGDGSLRYQATAGFSGTDQFTYVVTDGQLPTATRTVLITVPASTAPDTGTIVLPGAGSGTTPTQPGTTNSNPDNTPQTDPEPTKDTTTSPLVDKATPKPVASHEPPAAVADTQPTSTPPAKETAVIARQASSTAYLPANASTRFTLNLNDNGLGLGLHVGNNVLMNLGNGPQAVAGLSLGSGLNLSINTAAKHGDANAALLNFTDTPDDQLVKVQKIAVQTSGAAVSVGAVWWATRVSGLLASLMISTPAWRSLDPLPVMGLDDPSAEDGEDGDDPLQPESERHMDERAAGLFASKTALSEPGYEHIA